MYESRLRPLKGFVTTREKPFKQGSVSERRELLEGTEENASVQARFKTADGD